MFGNIIIDTLVTGLPLIPAFLGLYIVLKIREDFDLTIEGSFALGGATAAVLIAHDVSPAVAIASAVVSGMVAGATTALLHLWLKVPVLMAGLVMNMAWFTITLRIMGTPTISLIGHDTVFSWLAPAGTRPSDVAICAMLGFIVAVILALFAIFLKTQIGLAFRGSGVNARMVRSQGVNDNGMMALSLIVANALSGLSGALIAQVQGFGDINMGVGVFIAGVGGVLLGSLILNPSGSQVGRIVVTVLIGAVLYRLILVAALRVGLAAGDLKGVTAVTLVAALALQLYVGPHLAKLRRRSEESRASQTSAEVGADR